MGLNDPGNIFFSYVNELLKNASLTRYHSSVFKSIRNTHPLLYMDFQCLSNGPRNFFMFMFNPIRYNHRNKYLLNLLLIVRILCISFVHVVYHARHHSIHNFCIDALLYMIQALYIQRKLDICNLK